MTSILSAIGWLLRCEERNEGTFDVENADEEQIRRERSNAENRQAKLNPLLSIKPLKANTDPLGDTYANDRDSRGVQLVSFKGANGATICFLAALAPNPPHGTLSLPRAEPSFRLFSRPAIAPSSVSPSSEPIETKINHKKIFRPNRATIKWCSASSIPSESSSKQSSPLPPFP